MSQLKAYDSESCKSFRLAQKTDAAMITEIQKSTYQIRSTNNLIWHIDAELVSNSKALSIEESLEQPDHYCFVCCHADRITGFINFKPVSTSATKNLELQITIDHSLQSKGWGTYLLTNSIDYLIENTNTDRLTLMVEKENKKALGLYHKVGFNTVNTLESNSHLFWIMSKSLTL